jgi:hypothetical protein
VSDLTDMLSDPDFKTGDYTVTRRAAATWSSGEATSGATSTFTTGNASLQPASAETLAVAPEGAHATGVADLWTTTELRTVTDATPADIVTIGTEAWRVVRVAKHVGMGGTHYIVGLARGTTP